MAVGRLRFIVLLTLVLALPGVYAQGYPAKPVRIIVPWPAAGGADFFARTVAERLAATFAKQVLVDNRPGAGGTIGTEAVARAAPDAYTLLFTTPDSLTISPRLAGKALYDPLKDFAPVVTVALTPNILVAHPSLPARNVKELVALAKSRPGEINYASNGIGTLSHLTGELFKLQSGANLLHVPYNGGPPAVIATVSGEASVLFTAFPTAIGQVNGGKLRALGVCGVKRVSMAPEVPTIAETIPGFDSTQWYGLFVPAATPAALIDRLNTEVLRVLAEANVRKQFADNSGEVVGGTAAELAAWLKRDFEKWGSVMTKAGMRPL